jgi:hypothetical protein
MKRYEQEEVEEKENNVQPPPQTHCTSCAARSSLVPVHLHPNSAARHLDGPLEHVSSCARGVAVQVECEGVRVRSSLLTLS